MAGAYDYGVSFRDWLLRPEQQQNIAEANSRAALKVLDTVAPSARPLGMVLRPAADFLSGAFSSPAPKPGPQFAVDQPVSKAAPPASNPARQVIEATGLAKHMGEKDMAAATRNPGAFVARVMERQAQKSSTAAAKKLSIAADPGGAYERGEIPLRVALALADIHNKMEPPASSMTALKPRDQLLGEMKAFSEATLQADLKDAAAKRAAGDARGAESHARQAWENHQQRSYQMLGLNAFLLPGAGDGDD